jgi:hypothetical protein
MRVSVYTTGVHGRELFDRTSVDAFTSTKYTSPTLRNDDPRMRTSVPPAVGPPTGEMPAIDGSATSF